MSVVAKHRVKTLLRGNPEARVDPIPRFDEEHASLLTQRTRTLSANTSERLQNVRGRIAEFELNDGDRVPRVHYNTAQRVDNARMMWYNEDEDAVHIRIDHSETPAFWLEFDLPMEQVVQFIGEQLAVGVSSDDDALPRTPQNTPAVQDPSPIATPARRAPLKRKRSNSSRI